MEQRSLRVLDTNKTFFSKLTSTITKMLIPTKVSINGMMISIKRNNLIKAYSNYEVAVKEDDIDKAVGIVLTKKNADKVKKGDILAFVYANNKQKGETAVEEMQDAYTIVEEPVKKEKYILGII